MSERRNFSCKCYNIDFNRRSQQLLTFKLFKNASHAGVFQGVLRTGGECTHASVYLC